MINLLEYIKQNYQTHFKDLSINEANAFDIDLFEKIKDNVSSNESSSKSPGISAFAQGRKKESSSSSPDYSLNFDELYIIAFPNFLDQYDKFVDLAVRRDVNQEKYQFQDINSNLNQSKEQNIQKSQDQGSSFEQEALAVSIESDDCLKTSAFTQGGNLYCKPLSFSQFYVKSEI